jgi:hypothetical protein
VTAEDEEKPTGRRTVFFFAKCIAYTSNYHIPVAGSTFSFRAIKIWIKIDRLMFMSNYLF